MSEFHVNMGLYFLKYILAYGVLFAIIPCFIFTNIKTDLVKSIMANFIKMTFWVVAIGYITVMLRLFEFITFFVIVFTAISYKYYKRNISSGRSEIDMRDDVQIMVINHLENVERIENRFFRYIVRSLRHIGSELSDYFGNPWSVIGFLVLCTAFGYAGYLHFYDSFHGVAPAAGESYLTIVRMKYLGGRILFYDNIYPQGFYIVMETLQKMMQMDHLFVVRFTGAFHTILVAFGLYFFVSRIAKNQAGGILAVILYGILGGLLVQSPTQQIVASPGQFAILFVLPVLYFFYEYIRHSKQEDFFAAFFGSALIGLVHPLAFAFLAIGLLALCIANLLRDIKNTAFRMIEVLAFMLMATLLAVLPIGIGLLLGKTFGSTMVNYLFARQAAIQIPALGLFDYLAAGALVLILLRALIGFGDKESCIKQLWMVLFGAGALTTYLYGGITTSSVYVNEGAKALWTLLIPVLIAFGAEAVFAVFRLIPVLRYTGHIACIGALVGVLIYFPQQPTLAQKQEYDSSVEQYIRITKTFRPTQWMIVSWQEGYALSLGNGYHMMIDEFIDRYDPKDPELLDRYDTKAGPLKMEDVLIFYEKRVHGAPSRSLEETQYRTEMRGKIKDWLGTYQEHHRNLTLFYNDENLEVWQIHFELDEEERMERLWQQ